MPFYELIDDWNGKKVKKEKKVKFIDKVTRYILLQYPTTVP